MNESDEVIMARALQIMQATLERRDAEIARLKPAPTLPTTCWTLWPPETNHRGNQISEIKNHKSNRNNPYIFGELALMYAAMALTFNGCMMHVDIGQDNASETAKKLIASLKEAAKWYDEFLKREEGKVKREE